MNIIKKWLSRAMIVVAAITAAAQLNACDTANSIPTKPSPGSTVASDTTTAASCGGNLRVSLSGGNGASQHVVMNLDVTNTGKQPCTLEGYPTVALLTKQGSVVGHAQPSTAGYMCMGPCQAVVPIRLAPGASAQASLEWADVNPTNGGSYNATSCPDYGVVTFSVTPPGETTATDLAASTSVCSNVLIHALRPSS